MSTISWAPNGLLPSGAANAGWCEEARQDFEILQDTGHCVITRIPRGNKEQAVFCFLLYCQLRVAATNQRLLDASARAVVALGTSRGRTGRYGDAVRPSLVRTKARPLEWRRVGTETLGDGTTSADIRSREIADED